MMHLLGRLISITISYSLFIALVERAYTLFLHLYRTKVQPESKGVCATARAVEHVESLQSFDYRGVEPIKYRPFETKHHVIIGMQQSFTTFLMICKY